MCGDTRGGGESEPGISTLPRKETRADVAWRDCVILVSGQASRPLSISLFCFTKPSRIKGDSFNSSWQKHELCDGACRRSILLHSSTNGTSARDFASDDFRRAFLYFTIWKRTGCPRSRVAKNIPRLLVKEDSNALLLPPSNVRSMRGVLRIANLGHLMRATVHIDDDMDEIRWNERLNPLVYRRRCVGFLEGGCRRSNVLPGGLRPLSKMCGSDVVAPPSPPRH